jgi:ParB/RepB/Spo0J family partition protein
MVPLARLHPHPMNPRLVFREDVVTGIAASIKDAGTMRPEHALRVRPFADDFQIVSGHQRAEAARVAGLEEVPCWVREMTDDEAYMALVLDNRHGELKPLEIGLHALECVGKSNGGRGKKGGLKQYAEQMGKTQPYLTNLVQAAKVAKHIAPAIGLADLNDKAHHLWVIHSLPRSAWQKMVEVTVIEGWFVKDVQSAIERYRAYEKEPTVADWPKYLPVAGCALAVAVNDHTPAHFKHLAYVAGELLSALAAWKGLKQQDRKQLSDAWTDWLHSNAGDDSWDAGKVAARRVEIEMQAGALADDETDADECVLHGDFRTALAVLRDESADLIFTDPPYDRETLPLYGAMAEIAARILKPGGSLVCYLGQYQLHEVCALVTPHLRLWWTLACVHTGDAALMNEYGVRVHWKPMLWFVKGTRGDKQTIVRDLVESTQEKDAHEWQQSLVEARYYVENLCPPGGMVVDPFCGGGTTAVAAKGLNRRWLTCDVDPETVARARRRVRDAS